MLFFAYSEKGVVIVTSSEGNNDFDENDNLWISRGSGSRGSSGFRGPISQRGGSFSRGPVFGRTNKRGSSAANGVGAPG